MTQTLEQTRYFNLQAGDSALFVHAHPDDESVFTGSAIASLAAEGIITHTATASNGEASRKGDPGFVRSGQRVNELHAALGVLGVPTEQRHLYQLRDGKLWNHDTNRSLASSIGSTLLDHNIRTIITPGEHGVDGHLDHKAVHRAAVRAARFLVLKGVTVNIWSLQLTGHSDVQLPVDRHLKASAVAAHASQFSGADAADLHDYRGLLQGYERYSRLGGLY